LNWLRLYSDFCERVVQNAYRDVPTKARNIVEWMVTWKLRSQGHKATGKLGDDLNTVKQLLTDPKTRARLDELGNVPMPMTPAEFGTFIAAETEKWREVVKFSGAKAQ